MTDGYRQCTDVCGKEKPLSEFYFRKDTKKYKNICKECHSKKCNKYRQNNHEKILFAKKKYRDNNKDDLNEKAKRYAKNNREKINQNKKGNPKTKAAKNRYYEKHKNEILLKQKQYREKNADEINARRRNKSKETKSAVREKALIRHNERMGTDINYKIAVHLRGRLNIAIRHGQKVGSAVNDLGCSIKYLIEYFTPMFYTNTETGEPMSWENYGLWHIDHIMPLSSFDLTDKKQFSAACNYKNLQPLWAKDNLKKGDRIKEQINDS